MKMRNYVVVAGILAVGAALAVAEDTKDAPAPGKVSVTAIAAKAPVAMDMALVGKLTMEDKVRDGRTNTIYVLTEANGRKIHLPPDKIEVKGSVDLKQFVGKQVKMAVKGAEVTRGERVYVMVKEVITAEAVEAAIPPLKAESTPAPPKTDAAKGE